ncbi:MAG: potassium-transporting ATPase subunit C [Solirubrobacterales bacterium]
MNALRKDLITGTIAIVLFTLVLGIAYPLITTGVAQVLFPNASDGSKIEVDGTVVGSKLIGQDFRRPVLRPNGKPRLDKAGEPVLAPDPAYFQSRPSATGYSANVTYFNNLGPNNKELSGLMADQLHAYLKLERPYDPGLTAADVPVDAVSTSASGVDPHISEANARIQAHRVAEVRGLPLERVLDLVGENTDGRFLALFGEPGVNVLKLNLALDKETNR